MRFGLGTLLVACFLQLTSPQPTFFRYERPLQLQPSSAPGTRACTLLDGILYAHARPALDDVRLFSGVSEVPYALTMSDTAPLGDAAKILNLGLQGSHISFDLQMPNRPYTNVNLDLTGENFLATAHVTGLATPGQTTGTALGTYTLFDLAAQHLSRSTVLPLQESTFPYLHVELAITGASGQVIHVDPAIVRGAQVPPSREAQTLYTSVAASTDILQRGPDTIVAFELPAHVPVERVRFELAPTDRSNFSRPVRIEARAEGSAQEVIAGEISRIRLNQAGQEIRQQVLSVPATLGANAKTPAHVEVAIANGDNHPLVLRSVHLEMRERKLCFDVPADPVELFYGDPNLAAPVYDYSRLFRPGEPTQTVRLEPEQPNPVYTPRREHRPLSERHPELLWIALFALVTVLGTFAFRSARRVV